MAKLKGQVRKEEIVRAAIDLFSKKGFSGTTTKELAKAAGISEALVFKHFPDKKSLYQEILSLKMNERCYVMLEMLPESGALPKILLKVAEVIVEEKLKDPSFLRLLHFSALEGNELSDLFFQQRNLPIVDYLKNIFRQSHKRAELSVKKKEDYEILTRAFLDMIYGYLITLHLFRIPEVLSRNIQKTLKAYVDLFTKGCLHEVKS